jgi:Uncharacterized homolog of PrgY (pheromone shutdown protein)
MEKFAPKSAENNISVEKSNLSDSSISVPEENGVSVPLLAIRTGESKEKLDISSNFIANSLSDSVSIILIPSTSQSPDGHQAESKIVLIGTAHVSEKSVEEVRSVIRSLKPDVVAVELCKGRFDSLEGNTQEEQVPIKDLLSGGKIYYYIIHWLLAHLQKKIGEDMGVRPGAEMLSAMEEASDIGANIALIDRDIQVTLQRFWGKMKFLEKGVNAIFFKKYFTFLKLFIRWRKILLKHWSPLKSKIVSCA